MPKRKSEPQHVDVDVRLPETLAEMLTDVAKATELPLNSVVLVLMALTVEIARRDVIESRRERERKPAKKGRK